MRIGLVIPTWVASRSTIGQELASLARRADQAGIASLWVADHFFLPSAVSLPGEMKSISCFLRSDSIGPRETRGRQHHEGSTLIIWPFLLAFQRE